MGNNLQEGFLHLLQKQGATPEQAQRAWEELFTLYTEKGRFYHTLSHIEHMLLQMEKYVPDSLKTPELALAIWYHDVIYDPESKDNESESAKLCLKVLGEITALSTNSLKTINSLIMSTKGHQVLLKDSKKQTNEFLLDLDLSILGMEWPRYEAYSHEIRQEYSMIPLPDYKTGRSQVLSNFLTREDIYFSSLFKNLYEKKARENLKKEIQKLKD